MSKQSLEDKSDRELLFSLYGKVDDVCDELRGLTARVGELALSHEALRKNVYGNGAVGLYEKHNALEKDVKGIRKFLLWVFGGLGGLIGLFLFEIIIGKVNVVFK